MKLRFNHIMTSAAALLLLAGCMQKEEDFGQQVRVLTAKLESGADTRVSFDKDGKFKWNTGDKIAVFVGSAYQHDIVVEPSTGRITVNGNRSRYAVYPSDAADDSSAGNGNPDLNVILPTGYDITDIVSGASSSDPYAPGDDYSPMPMVAENNPMEDVLFFRHVGGLLRYKWINLPAGTKTVTVAFDTDVTGTYGVDVVDMTKPTIKTAGTGSNNVVTFKVSEAGLTAAKTVVFNIPVPVGHYGSVTVSAYDAAPTGTGNQLTPPSATPTSTRTFTDGTDVTLVFDRHWGRMLASDGTFTYFIDGLEDITVEYTGGAPELAREFYSYKSDGRDKYPVPFVLEYSADGATGWTTTAPTWFTMDTGDFGGSTDGEFLRVNISEQPNQAEDPHADYLRGLGIQSPYHDVNHPFNLGRVNVATGVVSNTLSSANCYVVQAPGYYAFPLVYGNTLVNGNPNQSAYNSYTASGNWRTNDDCDWSSNHEGKHPSNYNPAPNPKSVEYYWSTQKNATTPHPHSFWYMGYFRDHADKPIVRGKPSTINSVANSTDYSNDNHWFKTRFSGKTLTAKIIWTDAPGLVTHASVDNTKSVIMFRVMPETICQGNAVIAVLADDVILWSWHIWVTDEDLTQLKNGSNNYKFAPVNIGWCDPKEVERRDERKVYVRARQSITGVLDADNYSNTVLVTSKAGQYIKIGGHSPYYQWGRKDPLASAYLQTTVNKDGTTVEPVQKPYIYHADYAAENKVSMGEWVSIGTAIQHPYVLYSYSGTDPHGWNWTTSWIINLWNSNIQGYGESYSNVPVVKTIYDPSPIGFCVPPRAAYTGFNSSVFVNDTRDGDTGRTYTGGLFFPNAGYDADGKYLYDYALYWSATTESLSGDYRQEYSLSFTPEYPYLSRSAGQQSALPVRPVAQ